METQVYQYRWKLSSKSQKEAPAILNQMETQFQISKERYYSRCPHRRGGGPLFTNPMDISLAMSSIHVPRLEILCQDWQPDPRHWTSAFLESLMTNGTCCASCPLPVEPLRCLPSFFSFSAPCESAELQVVILKTTWANPGPALCLSATSSSLVSIFQLNPQHENEIKPKHLTIQMQGLGGQLK